MVGANLSNAFRRTYRAFITAVGVPRLVYLRLVYRAAQCMRCVATSPKCTLELSMLLQVSSVKGAVYPWQCKSQSCEISVVLMGEPRWQSTTQHGVTQVDCKSNCQTGSLRTHVRSAEVPQTSF